MRQRIILAALLQLVLLAAFSQGGGTAIGAAMPGNGAAIGVGRDIGKSTLPLCLPTSVACVTPSYVFTGNGYWTIESNWLGNLIPPAVLPSGKTITINPAEGGECILNIPQIIGVGAQLTVVPGKRLRVSNQLSFLQ